MALRLRRGTDAERQLITPLEGELIYATDTKSLYVGDGTTLGGILIAASGEVSNTVAGLLDTDIAGLQDGDVLVYNSLTNEWNNRQSALELTDLTDVGISNPLNFDVVGYDGLNWKNVSITDLTNRINQLTELTDLEGVGINNPKNFHILYYDGNIWSNRPVREFADQLLSTEGTHTLTLAGDDSTILVDPVTNRHRGDFYGSLYDGIGNLVIDEFTKGAMVDVRDPTNTYTVLDNFTGDLRRGENGQLIIQGGATPTFLGSVDGPIRGTVVGPDLNIILDHDTGTLYGDVIGSVFGDDSTLMIDGINGKIVGPIETINLTNLEDVVIGQNSVNPGFTYYSTATNGLFPISVANISNIADSPIANEFSLFKARGTINNQTIVQLGDTLGSLSWAGYDGVTPQVAGCVKSEVNSVSVDNISADIIIATRNGNINTYEEVIRFKADKGTIAKSYVQFGSLTSVERDALTPANGMVIYNTTNNKFEGYQNSGWINLDDGLPAS